MLGQMLHSYSNHCSPVVPPTHPNMEVCHILTTSGRFLISQPTMSPGQLMQYGSDQTRPWHWAKATSKLAIFLLNYFFIPLDGSETRWGLKSLYYVNPLASQIVTFNIRAEESPSIQKDSNKNPKTLGRKERLWRVDGWD